MCIGGGDMCVCVCVCVCIGGGDSDSDVQNAEVIVFFRFFFK